MKRPLLLRLALLWIFFWDPLAPPGRRRTWRDQWSADVWHYHEWLRQQNRSGPAVALSLGALAWAAPLHALVLRLREWSLHMLLHDLRFALRMLLRRPAFAGVAVLVLGLGIGANATIFSWIETIALEPLPGAVDQRRLVAFHMTYGDRADLSFSYPDFLDFRAAQPPGVEDLIAHRPVSMTVRATGDPVRVSGELATANFLDVLGVRPMLGRGFVDADTAAPGREPVAIVSYALWSSLFASDPAVAGREITINARPFTVIGVTPPGFRGSMPGLMLDVFLPITMQPAVMSGSALDQRGTAFLEVLGRITPDADLEGVQASASVIAARFAQDHPEYYAGHGIRVTPLWRYGMSGTLMPVMGILMAVVGVVLLIACANLAGLLLARAAGRQRELAIRLAVGASRARLIRQLLAESLLLAAAGGVAGIFMAHWTSGAIAAVLPRTTHPVDVAGHVSFRVLAFSTVLTLLTAAAVGLLPALRASRGDVTSALKSAGSMWSGAPVRGRLRQGLVVGQLAMSLALLVCAALFIRSLARAQAIDPGFSMRQGVIAAIDLLSGRYQQERGVLFFQTLLQRLSSLPGIEAATIASDVPLDPGSSSLTVSIDGYQPRPAEDMQAFYNRVAPGYFETLGIPIVAGRAIDARDTEGQPLAVVINETMARRYWAGRDPIGARLDFGAGPAIVVGVAKDGKYMRLDEQPQNYMCLALYQLYRPGVQLQVRTAGDPRLVIDELRREVGRLDPNIPLFQVRTMEEHLRWSTFVPRMAGLLLGLFGGLALLLAAVGLYSVLAFSVAQRTREIGIRIALGAGRQDVVRLVVRQGLSLVLAGLGIGLLLAVAAGRLVAGQLVGVQGTDAVSFLSTAVILLAVALAACLVPARHAARLDAIEALRRE